MALNRSDKSRILRRYFPGMTRNSEMSTEPSTSRQVAENTAAATEIGDPVAARDANSSDRLTYSLSGTDASSFDINVGNGQLLTKAALDYETKGDYTVVVVVSDGRRRSDRITVTVTVTNVEEPEFVGSASVMYEENGTDAVETYTTDPEGTSVSWSLSGADAGEFTIDGGELRFAASPDFEAPRDADSDNAYEVMVETADGTGNTGTVDVTVTVGNVEEPGTLVLSTGSPVLGRTIAKSLSSTVEAGDGLRWAEGASLGSQGHGHPGWKPSFQAQDVQPGVDQGGEYLAQPRTAQRVDVLIPTAVLHVMQAVLNAPVVAEQPEQFLRLALPGTQAGQQIPTLPAHLPGGYVHALLLHHRPLPRPGKSQLIPDVVGQYGIAPDAPSLDHARFFSRVSACGSPGSSPAKPSVNAASTVG